MEKPQIESWAYKVIERVVHGKPTEDSRVELKTGWSDAKARQLAALANAAHGEEVLWIVGVDEEGHSVPGADAVRFNEWWQSIRSQFDGAPPAPHEHVMNYGDVAVVAILFETDAPPYVVKVQVGKRSGSRRQLANEVLLEVPWREGTSTRSALKGDLLSVLLPIAREPIYEPLTAELTYHRAAGITFGRWRLAIRFYATSRTADPNWIPFHSTQLRCRVDQGAWVDGRIHWLVPAQGGDVGTGHGSATIVRSATEVGIRGPGTVEVLASVEDSAAGMWGLQPSSRPTLGTDAIFALAAPFERIRSHLRWTFRCLSFDPGGTAAQLQTDTWRFVAVSGSPGATSS